MKRIISFLMTLFMVTSTLIAVPFSAYAYGLGTGGQIGDNVYYNFDESTGAVTITGTGDTWNYRADVEDDGWDSPFYYDGYKIKSITIGDGVTSIGDRLFNGALITGIEIPDSVKKIGKEAFEDTDLTAVTIPDSVTSIGDSAFSSCYDLEKVVIPGSLKSIPEMCFQNSENLKEVYIGKGVEKVEFAAFYITPDNPMDVYYSGSGEDWAGVTIKGFNDALLNANMHYNVPLPAEYDLWVGGAQVTSENLSGDGWSYEPSTNTLSLNDFRYEGGGHVCSEDASHAAAVYYGGNSAFNVVAEGKNVVTHNELNAAASCALYSETQLNISGHGTLELYSGFGTAYARALLVNGSLNVEDVTLKAVATGAGDNYGIKVSNEASFKNCSVDASAGDCEPDYRSCGIGSEESFTVYIDDTVKSFVASGTSAAIGTAYDGRYATVVNSVAGTGWDDAAGTGGGTDIPINTEGSSLAYKKVEFPSPDKYDLWVGGTEVTSRNLSGEGWDYDPSTNTLTLNSFNYSGIGHRDDNNNCSPIYSDIADGLTLDLKGTSTVEETGENYVWLALGVYSKGALTVTGNGTINATSSGGCHNIGIYSTGDIVIDGGTVNGVAGDVTEYDYNSYGIYSIGSITINGGTVKGTGGAAPDAYSGGFFAYYDITVNGGSVTGTGGSAREES